MIESLPEGPQRLGEILVRSHVLTYQELEQALASQQHQAEAQQPLLGEILLQDAAVAPEVLDAALKKQKTGSNERAATANRFIRVDADRLDALINLIGELVINRQRVDLLASVSGNSHLSEAVTNMGNVTEQIRDAALTLRMVPIGDSFQRFKRIARDAARELGKEIDLRIKGAETELDRSMVEKITDPLTHIVRNALDHGIEPVALRRERGKSDMGVIELSARHEGGNIVIGIRDDGGGLNAEKIRKKAVAAGLVEAEAHLSEQDIFQLIFHPGLTTAESVTNLSGRGVGMDVVKRNIESLRGSIDIESTLGKGTHFTIRLPLTLAIIDGFHVSAGGIDFIVPQNAILECVDLPFVRRQEGQNCVNLRGEQVPFIRLQTLFQLQARLDCREKMLVVQFGEHRAGIVVDELHGEIQTVIKPLGPIFQALRGIGGSSLLGTGTVALIIDVSQLIALAVQSESRQYSAVSAESSRASP